MKTIQTLLVMVVVLLGISAQAAQLDNGTLTNSITTISNSTSTAASQAFILHPGSQLALSVRFNGAGTTNVAFGFNLYDGQNWTTTTPFITTNACAGLGTNVTGYLVLTKAQLEGYSQIRWDYTQTADLTNIFPAGVDYQQSF